MHERVAPSRIARVRSDERARNSGDITATQVTLSDGAAVRDGPHNPNKALRDESQLRRRCWARADPRSGWRLDSNSSIDERGDGIVGERGQKTLADRAPKLVVHGAKVYGWPTFSSVGR
jgi:hypothetical protein